MMTERSHSTIRLRWPAVVVLVLVPLLVVAGLSGRPGIPPTGWAG